MSMISSEIDDYVSDALHDLNDLGITWDEDINGDVMKVLRDGAELVVGRVVKQQRSRLLKDYSDFVENA